MIELKRASPGNKDLDRLIEQLDDELWKRYPQTQQFYAQFNILGPDVRGIVAYEAGVPVGCGCIRETGRDDTIEIKRMFVLEKMRGKGVASMILRGLEEWAAELGMREAILETGTKQPEAVALYEKAGYRRIKNFGPFVDDADSICMVKDFKRTYEKT